MTSIDKRLLRLAVAIHTSLTRSNLQDRFIDLSHISWQRCVDLVRQIRRAQLRGWHLAAQSLATDLRLAIPSLQSELSNLLSELPADPPHKKLMTIGDIYQDLLALSEEFEEMAFDMKRRWLLITTEPIELEGIYLGPFQIRLQLDRPLAREAPAYRVIARDPHPAESRDNVTHPHVLDEVLCEGDGKHAIRQALAQGRLLDFFSLVAGVLRNYNPESSFVELAMWYGQACSDCGTLVSEDERFTCQRCGETVCGECELCCPACEDSACSNCVAACAACDETFCSHCLRRCVDCHECVCSGCLEDERCPNCHGNEELESIDDAALTAGAAVQPHGLGQALAPAGFR
jgi:hypothetical protein